MRKFRFGFARMGAAACALLALLALIGVASQQSFVQAEESTQEVTRGVVDTLEQVPDTKKAMYDNNESTYAKGTKENPFLILEIVPYEGYASIGYQIAGCEPTDVESMKCGGGALGTIGGVCGADVERQEKAYFFPDESEAATFVKNGTPLSTYWNYGEAFEGYYEKVKDGEGSFVQSEDGTITKQDKGNIIWHTVNEFELENYTGVSFTESATKKLENEGERIYTTRTHTLSDPVYITWTYYTYKNPSNFLTNTLELGEEEAKNYSVIVKTITPAELNDNPQWVQYADLFVVEYTEAHSGLSTVWKNWGKYATEEKIQTNPSTSFADEGDISWEVALAMYERINAETNYAALVMDWDVLLKAIGSGISVTFDILDWNLNKSGYQYPGTGYNNNIWKLAVMIYSMKYELFEPLFLSGENPVIQNGSITKLDGDAADYWTMYTFCLTDENGAENRQQGWYNYWCSQDSWGNYGMTGNFLGLSQNNQASSYVNNHVFIYPSGTTMTDNYVKDGLVVNERFTDFWDDMKERYPDSDTVSPTPSDAVRYVLGGQTGSSSGLSGTLNVLDIEPCYDSKNGYSLKESYIRLMVPDFTGTIEITHMTMSEFIGNTDDLVSTYDLIYMGLDDGAYNLDDDGYTTWNDSSMKGKIYFHTGDVMEGADYTNDGRSRSVDFVVGADGQTLRFSGNDITKLKTEDLEEFLNAGKPIVATSYLYKTDKTRIDQYSNICAFIKNYVTSTTENGTTTYQSSATLYKPAETTAIENALAASRPEVTFDTLPNSYDGSTSETDVTVIKNPGYLERDSNGYALLPFSFTLKNESNKEYCYRIYVDQNQDSKFSDDEVLYTYNGSFTEGSYSYKIKLSKLYVGVVNWKIEVYQVGNEAVHVTKTGCSAAKNITGQKKEIKVLQVMPDNAKKGKLDLSSNELFTKYYDSIDDYEISVDAITLSKFYNKYFEEKFVYDYSKDITDSDATNANPSKMSDAQIELYESYNMIILGFGDTYGGSNISNDRGAVDFLKYYVAQGKSILFTHDLTSLHNTETDDFGYSANTLLRDLMGMNRYAAVSKNLSDSEKAELKAYQSKHSYDTVTDVNGNTLDQTHGFTYYALKRLGWSENPASTNYKMPFQYLIKNISGEAICGKTDFTTVTGFNNNNDLTTKVTRTNEGQITQYPFKIDEELEVASTHGQWYQLNMEDPEVTVWYCLADDGTYSAWQDTDNNGTGTAATYGVSPNDVSNNYYIYSKGNVFYSGVGHSTVNGDMEAKLFINTMIAAYRASYEPPVVEVLNEEAELVDVNDMKYEMSFAQEYNGGVTESASTAVPSEEQEGTKVGEEDDFIKVRFTPTDLNAVTTEISLSVYYGAQSAADKAYLRTIYKADGTELTATYQKDGVVVAEGTDGGEWVFDELESGQEYYFYYPKAYLNAWTDASGTSQTARRTVTFKCKNDKAKLAGYTELDMSMQALFLLD